MATLSATLQKLMEEQKADRLKAKLLREQDLQAHKAVVETLAAQLAKANLSTGPKEEAMPPLSEDAIKTLLKEKRNRNRRRFAGLFAASKGGRREVGGRGEGGG